MQRACHKASTGTADAFAGRERLREVLGKLGPHKRPKCLKKWQIPRGGTETRQGWSEAQVLARFGGELGFSTVIRDGFPPSK